MKEIGKTKKADIIWAEFLKKLFGDVGRKVGEQTAPKKAKPIRKRGLW